MPLYKVSELIAFLEQLGIAPRKGLSQNFLIDGNILRKIVATGDVHENDPVLEIGAGPGALTELLLDAKVDLVVVEKDSILADALHRFQKEGIKLEIFCQDILDFPLHSLFERKKAPLKVIANLPYHITTPIINQLVEHHESIHMLVLMVQEEVARRMTAKPGSKEYGSLTVYLNYHANLKYGFKVSRTCFFPVPQVDSAVVILYPKAPMLAQKEQDLFFKLTRTAFQMRRKMIRVSLKELYPKIAIEKTLLALNLNPSARPEELSLENFMDLFLNLEKQKNDG